MKCKRVVLAIFLLLAATGALVYTYVWPSPIPGLVSHLHSTSAVERVRVAWKLRSLGERAAPAIPSLISLLKDNHKVWYHEVDPDPTRSLDLQVTPGSAAGEALVCIGAPAVAPLLSAFRKGPAEARRQAALALARTGDPRAVMELASAIRSGDTVTRTMAAAAFAQSGCLRTGALAKQRLTALLQGIKDTDVRVRMTTVYAMGSVYSSTSQGSYEPTVLEPVRRRLLTDSSAKVRRAAALALPAICGTGRTSQTERDLLHTLQDRSAEVRNEAISGLGLMRASYNPIEPLIDKLSDPSKMVRKRAAWALCQFTHEDFGQDPAKWKSWWRAHGSSLIHRKPE
jgi:HEAT repeat protein